MLFDSFTFGFFLIIVFTAYWIIGHKKLKIQNLLLLLASYFFYAGWSSKFVLLLLFSTFLDYLSGIQIENASNLKNKRLWFWLSICLNFGILAVFKYFNFFIQSFVDLAAQLKWEIDPIVLNVVLPVGISFYTFHGVSYIVDIYNNRITAERNFVNYAVFVSFFPLLVAGPIERATHLLPQIKKERVFNYELAKIGIRQILWGFFKKMVIADQCARFADEIFNNHQQYNGSTILLGAVFFAFQIYADFSAYSDIALGTARLFGIELLKNFSFPYFSRNMGEFWRRWHISLSSWFRDYLYIPLGGSKQGRFKMVRNTFIIFTVSGFWHGANWTFVIWGILNAIFTLPSLLMKSNSSLEIVAKGKYVPTLKEISLMGFTFLLVTYTWIFFRAENLKHVALLHAKLFSKSFFQIPYFSGIGTSIPIIIALSLFFFLEWLGREYDFALGGIGKIKNRFFRWCFYFSLIATIYIFQTDSKQFIYFQF